MFPTHQLLELWETMSLLCNCYVVELKPMGVFLSTKKFYWIKFLDPYILCEIMPVLLVNVNL